MKEPGFTVRLFLHINPKLMKILNVLYYFAMRLLKYSIDTLFIATSF